MLLQYNLKPFIYWGLRCLFGGAGGIRTLVRKWNCYAFYMLIETLVFELSWLFLGPA